MNAAFWDKRFKNYDDNVQKHDAHLQLLVLVYNMGDFLRTVLGR